MEPETQTKGKWLASDCLNPARLGSTRIHVPTSLQTLFDEFNRRYWKGRLPRYLVRRQSKIKDGDLEGLGVCNHQKKRIVIKSSLEEDVLREVLLHEMVHVRFPDEDHGPKFTRELRRLAARGERGLLRHAEGWEGLQNFFKNAWPTLDLLIDELRGQIDLLARENPRRHWKTIYAMLQDSAAWTAWLETWTEHSSKTPGQPPLPMVAWLYYEWEKASKWYRRRPSLDPLIESCPDPRTQDTQSDPSRTS